MDQEFANGRSTGQRMWSKYRLGSDFECVRGEAKETGLEKEGGSYASLPFRCRVNRYAVPI